MLNGWKAIAAYLGREERTAMRWAVERGMPVHRTPGPGRGSVYARADEIDAWLAGDRARAAAADLERGAESDRAVPVPVDAAPTPVRRLAARPRLWARWLPGAMIASGVALIGLGALTLSRSHAAPVASSEPAFADAATKSLFLQARYDWNLRTSDSLTRAVREYGQVIARDPRAAAAYVGLANSYLLLREFGSMSDAAAYPRAQAAAEAAEALSPQSPDVHRALAFIAFWWRGDRASARREFEQAIALAPNDPLTHHWFATALLANGEAQAALREIAVARDLDPTSPAILADQGEILYVAGHRDEGLRTLRTLSREQPDFVSPHRALAEIALAEGRGDEFLREAADVARVRGDATQLAQITRWTSERAGPGLVQATMLAQVRRQKDWFQVAQVAALAGHPDEARAALGRACHDHEPAAVSAPSDLWLARALSPRDVAQLCGTAVSLS